jgi:hypothetical protein
MKLYTPEKVKDSGDAVQVTKNSGKHVAWVPVYAIAKSLSQKGKQVVVEYGERRMGFDRSYIESFLNENCYIENIDFTPAQEYFNALRKHLKSM